MQEDDRKRLYIVMIGVSAVIILAIAIPLLISLLKESGKSLADNKTVRKTVNDVNTLVEDGKDAMEEAGINAYEKTDEGIKAYITGYDEGKIELVIGTEVKEFELDKEDWEKIKDRAYIYYLEEDDKQWLVLNGERFGIMEVK